MTYILWWIYINKAIFIEIYSSKTLKCKIFGLYGTTRYSTAFKGQGYRVFLVMVLLSKIASIWKKQLILKAVPRVMLNIFNSV